MSTRNIVPRANGEGSLGTAGKKWGNIQAEKLCDFDVVDTLRLRQNSTAYTVGAVVYGDALPSGLQLYCTTAGTTAAASPDFSACTAGATVSDGTVVWTAKSVLEGQMDYLIRLNSHAYAVGEIAFSPSLSSNLVLECTTAGTTDATEPNFSGASEGSTVVDGTVTWTYKGLVGSDAATRALDNLSAAGEQKLTDTTENVVYNDGFAIIYPNGGSENSPANVSANGQYIEANPFPGYLVSCEAEVLYNSTWLQTSFVNTTGGQGAGVTAMQNTNDETITVSVGNAGPTVGIGSNIAVGISIPISDYPGGQSSLPCRVKVWKIGKVASA